MHENEFLKTFNIIFKGSSVPDAPPPVSWNKTPFWISRYFISSLRNYSESFEHQTELFRINHQLEKGSNFQVQLSKIKFISFFPILHFLKNKYSSFNVILHFLSINVVGQDESSLIKMSLITARKGLSPHFARWK